MHDPEPCFASGRPYLNGYTLVPAHVNARKTWEAGPACMKVFGFKHFGGAEVAGAVTQGATEHALSSGWWPEEALRGKLLFPLAVLQPPEPTNFIQNYAFVN